MINSTQHPLSFGYGAGRFHVSVPDAWIGMRIPDLTARAGVRSPGSGEKLAPPIRMNRGTGHADRDRREEPGGASNRADPRWAAVVARDGAADGNFSTRSNDRRVLPAVLRGPPRQAEECALPRHCRRSRGGGLSALQALQARPGPAAEQHAAKVAEACRLIEAAEETPTLPSWPKRPG